MATLGELIVKIGADARGLTSGLNESTKQLNKWSKQAEKGIGPIMDGIGRGVMIVGAAAATGFGALVAGSVKGASSLEQYRNTLNIVMKDQEKAAEMMAWAVDFADYTPFNTDKVVEATVKLQSYGLEAQKVLPAVGDMAAVMNKDLIQAVEAVADAQTGELERLKGFGITKAMIVEQGNKIMRDKQIVNNKGQIVDQEAFNKALLSLMEERFAGGMAAQAKTFSGLMSTIGGKFSTTLATMAGISKTGEVQIGGLFDNIRQKAQLIVDKLNEWQKNGQLQEWADQAQKALSSFWAVASIAFNGIIYVGKWIIDNWGLIGPILAGVLAGFLAYITVQGVLAAVLAAVTLAQKALNLAMSMNPIGYLVLAIGALVTAGVLLYKNWDTITAKAKKLWINITEVWDGIKQSIVNTWNSIIDAGKNWVLNLWAGIKNVATSYLRGGILGIVSDYILQPFLNVNLFEIGANIIRGLVSGIGSMLSWAKNAAVNVATNIRDGIKNLLGISSPSTVMAEVGKNIVEGLAGGVQDNANLVTSQMSTLVESVKQKCEDVVGAVGDLQNKVARNPIIIPVQMGQPVFAGGSSLNSDMFGSSGTYTPPSFESMARASFGGVPLSSIGAGTGSADWNTPGFANGGFIQRPVLMTDLATGRPAGIAGEAGIEAIVPMNGKKVSSDGVTIIFQGPVYGALDFEQKVKSIVRDAALGGAFRGVLSNG